MRAAWRLVLVWAMGLALVVGTASVTSVALLAGSAYAGPGGCGAAGDADMDQVCDPDDNCPFVANTNQIDTNGNGKGDPCECGDSSGDGKITSLDASLDQRCVVELIPCQPLCDVTGDGRCTSLDASLKQRFVVGLVPDTAFTCAQLTGP